MLSDFGGVGGGVWEAIESVEANNSSVLEFLNGFNDSYIAWKLVIENLRGNSGDFVPVLQVSNDGGATYETAGYASICFNNTLGAYASGGAYSGVILSHTSNNVSSSYSGHVYIQNMSNSGTENVKIEGHLSGNDVGHYSTGYMFYDVYDALRLIPDADLFLSGKVTLYGMKG